MSNFEDAVPNEEENLAEASSEGGWQDVPAHEAETAHHAEPVKDEAEEPTVVSAQAVPDEPTVVSAQGVPDEPIEPAADQQKPSINLRLVVGAAAGFAIIVIVAIVLGFVLLGGGTRLSASKPSISHPDGITVALAGESSLRVKLSSIPREMFLQQEAGDDYIEPLEALPVYLDMKSPLYTIEASGEADSTIEIMIPNESQPYETLDLYSWDPEAQEWVFVPSHIDEAAETISTDARPTNVAVFQTRAVTPLIATTIEAGNVLDDISGSTLNIVYPTGLRVRADGALEGALNGGWQLGAGYAVVPVIYADDGAVLSELLNNEASLALHIEDLSAFIIGDGYSGVALDYRNIQPADREAFTGFVQQLSARLDEYNKLVIVFLPYPQGGPDHWDTGGYNWRALGAAADTVVIAGGDNPTAYAPEGASMALLRWAVGEISRLKIQLASSSMSVEENGGNLTLINYEDALAPLGSVSVQTTVPEGAEAYEPGSSLTFGLSGGFSDLLADPASGAYTYQLEDGRRVWVVTASAVRIRLDMANRYHIGGALITDMLDSGNDGSLITAINEFKVNSLSTVPNQLLMEWQVSGASGAVLAETTGLGTPLVWQASDAGEYTVHGQIIGRYRIDRGAVAVRVADNSTPVAETPTPAPTRRPSGSTNNNATPQATQPPAAPPPPVSGAGGSGGFELGGQVPSSLGPAPYLQAAGMNWVKFQAKWPYVDAATACSYVSSGHSAGLKVLLSIPGPLYPQSIDFGAYTAHLAAVGGCQPDAVEIWNEMNLDREWPAGQIDPASYVNNMLAPGFNAIKQSSPNTIVIIGALAPTGFDNGTNAWSDQRYLQGLAAAGAANYANCVGAHHNSGTTAPSVRSGRSEGDHYSWYFLPTLEVTYNSMGGKLPVCLTEFGYLTPEGYGPLPSAFSWGAGNTVAEQAAWLKEGADIARGLGWVRLMIIWNVGFTTYDSDPQAGYSIVRPDGSCPACDLLP